MHEPMEEMYDTSKYVCLVSHLLKFEPTESVVAVVHKDGFPIVSMRVDLPGKGEGLGCVDPIISWVNSRSDSHALDVSVLVFHTPGGEAIANSILKFTSSALEERGTNVFSAVRVCQDHWQQLAPNALSRGIPDHGVVRESDRQAVAAAFAVPLRGTREQAVRMVSRDEGTCGDISIGSDTFRAVPARHELRSLGARYAKLLSGVGPLKVELARAILQDLEHYAVRDRVIVEMLRSDSVHVDLAHGTLWWLVRAAPDQYLAPIGSVAVAISYAVGDGVVVLEVLDRIRAVNPDYPLAVLLERLYLSGTEPRIWAESLRLLTDQDLARADPPM